MSPVTTQLLTSALALPESERLELAEALLAASEPPIAGVDWRRVVDRVASARCEIDAGEVVLTPWPEVKRRVKARVEGTQVTEVSFHPAAEAEYEAALAWYQAQCPCRRGVRGGG